ncbi:glycosyltransferase [Pseudarthrobacter sp. MEB009]|uniref:glycosyltransferase family 2 protein n=1 Tax=Pseudarthrobacter sp. MEB009 TaxID=3040326 RepID=UPI0025544ACA|nr:glycosyltransferase [Pseudarthrobacter sp. MEB009]
MIQTAEQLVIAVLTYKRPEDLLVVLPRLLDQARSVDLAATVLVVDNDPAGSARQTVEDYPSSLVKYVHEPRPGIAAARNRAIREAASDSLLVFIDDDEVPSEQWLRHLLAQYRATAAAAVVGPVISEYAEPPEAWIQAGRFFDRRRLATGSLIDVAATNNLLLDMGKVHALGLAFDEKFGITGGSDTLFTRRLAQLGGTMVWCDEAVVVDRVPTGRLTRDWVLRRAFRSGNANVRVDVELAGSAPARAAARSRAFAAGSIRVAGGTIRVLGGLAGGSMSLRARGMRNIARGSGMLSGAAGYVYSEYRRN